MNALAPPPAPPSSALSAARARARVAIGGAVQGVGFRPFIYRLAAEHGLQGWVVNSCQGVTLEVEGPLSAVQRFLLRIEPERPPRSFIQSLESVYLDPVGYTGFEIRPSDPTGERTALVLPDVATCAECVREVFDPGNRRFGYPFTNCTHCGPRYSIIAALPYDRPNTSMKMFRMCEQCQAEYENPRDRRFHAQPNACPVCGPRLEWWDRTARPLQMRQAALLAGVAALRAGQIVAVKGLGGFHLMVDAGNEPAVTRLRRLKHREEKPFALLFPSLAAVRAFALVSDLEERALRSPEAPIVLLRRRAHVGCAPAGVCAAVAPDNPWLGIMLPYTPLHHLLLARLGRPVVATSGNLANEPICTDEHEAVERLGGIADWFLVHNRPILRHVDDSIVRVVLDRELVLRRARGYAPLPIPLPGPVIPTLAVGAHLKNTVALGIGRRIFLSQHIGDLEGAPALAAFTRVLADLPQLYASKPEIVAADAHPDYLSTQQAETMGAPVVSVQHHYAHVLACMAENALEGSVLGVSWDGAGYGPDQTVWGGEFLRITPEAFERVGHLRQFRLPGGDKAVEEPRRSALGLLYELFQAEALAMKDLAPVQAFTPAELQTMGQMLAGPINAPLTSSAGRLFDAVASLTGLRQEVRFEGQAALDLEFSVDQDECQQAYPVRLLGPPEFTDYEYAAGQTVPAVGGDLPVPASDTPFVLDWSAMVQEILHDLRAGLAVWVISAKFHNALTEGIVAAARRVREPRVVLSGGCFQNKYLLEQTVRRLREEGFGPYWHQRVPPNDGGVALGQVIAAARSRSKNRP